METTAQLTAARPPVAPARTDRGARPRILYLAANDPRTALTGAAQRVHAFVRFLSERFPVHFVCLEGAGEAPIRACPPLKECYPALVSAHALPFKSTRYFLISGDVFDRAEAILKAGEADIIMCDYGVWAAYGILLARRFGVPFVYSSHNVEWRSCFDKVKNDIRRLPLSLYYYGIERLGVQRADLVVAITDADARWYESWRGGKEIIVIPQGVDEREFFPETPTAGPGRRRILFCGNFKVPFNREALDVLSSDIAPEVTARHPEVVFECVGAHPPTGPMHPSMVFTGYADDYPERLRTCDAVISPILRGHGFPTKIVEALACGKATIATAVGARGLNMKVPHLRVRSIKDFAAAINDVLDAPSTDADADAALVRRHYGWDALLAPLEKRLIAMAGVLR